MSTLIIRQTKPESGRDTKICRAYLDCVSWECNPVGVSASSTQSGERAALRTAAKAFIKRGEAAGDPSEVEVRIVLSPIEHGRWLATLH